MADGFVLARVVGVHPEGVAVDVQVFQDGRLFPGVRVMGSALSGNTGLSDLPVPDLTAGEGKRGNLTTYKRDMIAVLGFVSNTPVVFGFVAPAVSQMLFPAAMGKGRRIDRHGSDVYTTITSAGDMETYHPSGTFFRVGQASAHEDLTGKDLNGNWKIEKNTGTAVHVHLEVANAGAVHTVIDIDPQGNVTLTNAGNLTTCTDGNVSITAKGNLSAAVSGTTTVESGGDATLKAPKITLDASEVDCTGNLSVSGNVTSSGSITASGDVKAGSVSLDNHKHTDSVGGTTTPPLS